MIFAKIKITIRIQAYFTLCWPKDILATICVQIYSYIYCWMIFHLSRFAAIQIDQTIIELLDYQLIFNALLLINH